MKLEKRQKKAKTDTSDYRQFSFRIPLNREKEFSEILNKLDRLHQSFKKTIDKKQFKLPNRNDIIIDALKIGLGEMIEQSMK